MNFEPIIIGMSVKFVLDTDAMHEEFFSDTSLIGIVCALPAYRFCGLMNTYFDLKLTRDIESDICLKTGQDFSYYFALYRYHVPMNSNKFSVYELKREKQSLLPELKQLDYLFMIQGPNTDEDALQYIDALRKVSEVQLARMIEIEKLKNVDYLLV